MGGRTTSAVLNVNGRPAIRISAELITETQLALLLDCEGDHHWIPKGVCRFNPAANTVDIQEWFYHSKFEGHG